MNALPKDARSIGQVLYDATKQPGWPIWEVAGQPVRDRHERAAEVIFNRGFRSGEETQKKAAPPPKAKELLKRLVELAHAARDFVEAQKADNVTVRVKAREHLVKLLEGVP